MNELTNEVAKLMASHLKGSNKQVEQDETLLVVRLIDVWSNENWFLSEYDPVKNTAYWCRIYFRHSDINKPIIKWELISIYKLSELRLFEFFDKVIVDQFFTPTKFKDLLFNKIKNKHKNKKDS